jgi:hypothetical protein
MLRVRHATSTPPRWTYTTFSISEALDWGWGTSVHLCVREADCHVPVRPIAWAGRVQPASGHERRNHGRSCQRPGLVTEGLGEKTLGDRCQAELGSAHGGRVGLLSGRSLRSWNVKHGSLARTPRKPINHPCPYPPSVVVAPTMLCSDLVICPGTMGLASASS